MPASALAHANLLRAEPQADASVSEAPAHVRLWFSERPEARLTEVKVFDQDRRRVDTGEPAAVDNDPLSILQPLPPDLPRGTYTVSWRLQSADDGHVTAGSFAFGIGTTPVKSDAAGRTSQASPPLEPLNVVVRWLSFLAAAGLFGLVVFPVVVLKPTLRGFVPLFGPIQETAEEASRRLDLVARLFAIASILAAALFIFDQTSRWRGTPDVSSIEATLSTGFGALVIARAALALAVLGLLLLLPAMAATAPKHRSLGAAAAGAFALPTPGGDVRRFCLAVLALGQLLLFSLTSHAAGVPNWRDVAILVDWTHVALAGLWIGGLLALGVMFGPAMPWPVSQRAKGIELEHLFRPTMIRFSRIALMAALGLAVTGLYQAVTRVGSLEQLLTTEYGRTLVLKTGIFSAALLLAGFHRFVLLPAVQRPQQDTTGRARRFFRRTMPLEALLGITVLAATGLLTSMSPPKSADTPAGALVRHIGDLRVELRVQPLRLGTNTFLVSLQSKGKRVANAEKVELQVEMLDMDMGESVVFLNNLGQGTYGGRSSVLGMRGNWRFHILARVPGQLDQRTSFDLEIDPSPEGSPGPGG